MGSQQEAGRVRTFRNVAHSYPASTDASGPSTLRSGPFERCGRLPPLPDSAASPPPKKYRKAHSYSSRYFIGTLYGDVNVTGATNLSSFQFDVSYDPTLISFQSVTEQGIFASDGVAFLPGVPTGSDTMSNIADAFSGSETYSGDTTLLTARG